MKKLKPFLAILLIIALLFFSFSGVSGANKYSMTLFMDSGGIYVCKSEGSSVNVTRVDNSSDFKYSFDSRVLSCCVTGGRLYSVVPTNQSAVLNVIGAKNGKIVSNTIIKTHHISNSTKMCVDSGGKIYLYDIKNNIEIYSSDGKYIKTTSNRYLSFTQVNGKVYAANSSGIYRLNGSSEDFVCACKANDIIYAVSADCMATLSGTVYNINTGKIVFCDDLNTLYSISFGSKSFMVLRESSVDVYNKSDSKLINSYKLGFNPWAVCTDGGNFYILKNTSDGLSVTSYKESNFLISSSTKSDVSSSPLTGIDFGKYKVAGKYIILPASTTRVEFKSEVKYDGYTLKFNKSGGLGTNTKVSFSKDNRSYVYSIIVKGDITGTGQINNNDIDIMFNCLFGIDKVGGVYKTAADMNGDGKLSNVDLVMQERIRNQ